MSPWVAMFVLLSLTVVLWAAVYHTKLRRVSVATSAAAQPKFAVLTAGRHVIAFVPINPRR